MPRSRPPFALWALRFCFFFDASRPAWLVPSVKCGWGASPHPTTDHWNRWEEDNQLMSDLGLQIARVSVEWARIEPRRGYFDTQALERYRTEY